MPVAVVHVMAGRLNKDFVAGEDDGPNPHLAVINVRAVSNPHVRRCHILILIVVPFLW